MSNFVEEADGVNLDSSADGFDANFLESTNKDAGYDPNKEPGQRSVTPPEGPYWFRYEHSKNSDQDQQINERTGLPNRWKPGVTKPKKGTPSSFIGTSLKALMLRPADGNKLSLEDFDSNGLAGRQLFAYISSLVMYGRSGLTDWLNSILLEKVPVDQHIRVNIQMAEELLQSIPEGIGVVKWSLQWKDENEEDTKKQFKDLKDLSEGTVAKFKEGTRSKAWPKDDEGHPKTAFVWNINKQVAQAEMDEPGTEGDEKVLLFARAELRDFLPFKAEE